MKQISIVLLAVILSACATSGSNVGNMSNGSTIRTDYVRDTSMATKGGTYEAYFRCDSNGENCANEPLGELIVANPTLLQQLFGGAAQVGSAYLIGEGLKDSGDTVNNANAQQQKQSSGKRGWSH